MPQCAHWGGCGAFAGDLARYLNCTQACYANYENGKRDISSETLQLLADYYQVSVDYLLGRTSAKTPYPPK